MVNLRGKAPRFSRCDPHELVGGLDCTLEREAVSISSTTLMRPTPSAGASRQARRGRLPGAHQSAAARPVVGLQSVAARPPPPPPPHRSTSTSGSCSESECKSSKKVTAIAVWRGGRIEHVMKRSQPAHVRGAAQRALCCAATVCCGDRRSGLSPLCFATLLPLLRHSAHPAHTTSHTPPTLGQSAPPES